MIFRGFLKPLVTIRGIMGVEYYTIFPEPETVWVWGLEAFRLRLQCPWGGACDSALLGCRVTLGSE